MYIYKTKPFKHQEEIIDDSWKRPYYALFMEMGLGKSKVIIECILAVDCLLFIFTIICKLLISGS